MLQVFEKIKPFDSTPVSLLVTTATLSPTRAGRLCGLYTLHLYFYVFAEPSVTVNDCYPTTASSVLLLSKQALQHCFNSRARQVSTERLLSNFVFEDCFRFVWTCCRQQPSCSTTLLKFESAPSFNKVFDEKLRQLFVFKNCFRFLNRHHQKPSCSTTERHEAKSYEEQVRTSKQPI